MVAVILRVWDYRIYGCSTVRHLLAVAIGQNEIENAFRNPEKKVTFSDTCLQVFYLLPAVAHHQAPRPAVHPTSRSETSAEFWPLGGRESHGAAANLSRNSALLGKHLQGLSPKAISVWVYGKHWSLGDFHKDQCLSYPAKDQVPCLSLSLSDHYWNEPADKQDTNDKQDM